MRELSDTEKKIMDAATIVFLEKGRDGARTQIIADLAGINKALLHYYFRSKDKLFELVAEREIRQFFGELMSQMPIEADFETWLRSFIHNYLQLISQRPHITRFVLWEIDEGADHLSGILKEMMENKGFHENPIVALVSSAMQRSSIRQVDPPQFFISLLGLCIFPFIARPLLEKMIDGVNVSSEDFLVSREAAIFDLVWNGLKLRDKNEDNIVSGIEPSNNWLPW